MKLLQSLSPRALLAKTLGGAGLVLSCGLAQAALQINFDDSTNGTGFLGSTALTTQYSPLGVTFASIGTSCCQSGQNGATVLNDGNPANVSQGFGFNALSGDYFLAFNTNLGTGSQVRLTFTAPVSDVSIYALANPNVQYPTNAARNVFSLTAFDASNNVVGSSSVQTGPATGNAFQAPWTNWQELSVSGQSITSVLLNANADGTAYSYGFSGGYDNLSFTLAPVPEPGTYALMLAGLGVMGFVARRRKSFAA